MKKSELYDRLMLMVLGMLMGELLIQMATNLLSEGWGAFVYAGTLIALLLLMWRFLAHTGKESEPSNRLDLIDLDEYELGIIRSIQMGRPPVPVPPIPHLIGMDWTAEDREIMERNREQAREILRRYLAKRARR